MMHEHELLLVAAKWYFLQVLPAWVVQTSFRQDAGGTLALHVAGWETKGPY